MSNDTTPAPAINLADEIARAEAEAAAQPIWARTREAWAACLRLDGYAESISYLHKIALRENRNR